MTQRNKFLQLLDSFRLFTIEKQGHSRLPLQFSPQTEYHAILAQTILRYALQRIEHLLLCRTRAAKTCYTLAKGTDCEISSMSLLIKGVKAESFLLSFGVAQPKEHMNIETKIVRTRQAKTIRIICKYDVGL